MNDKFFLEEGEFDEKENCVDKSLIGMACLESIHIDHKENGYLIEETHL